VKKAPAKAGAAAKKVTRPVRKPAARPAGTTVATLGGPTPSSPATPGGESSWGKNRGEELGGEEEDEEI